MKNILCLLEKYETSFGYSKNICRITDNTNFNSKKLIISRKCDKILKYYGLIKKEFPVEKIFIFGSYARGAEKEFSDIDVGVVLNLAAKNEIKISAKLWSLARKIDTSIEPFCIFKMTSIIIRRLACLKILLIAE